ncbi:MAG: UDP-N-acetylglucosamine 2-epimerase (non-hydrolyzing) [Elusimicrobiota bacterium]
MDKIKVMTILGTRPEIIRLSQVMKKLDEYTKHIIVHTGQNYDYELNEIFFKDLDIRKPDYFLKVDCSTLGKAYGNILIKSEEVFAREKPDAVLILGDTNSSISALMAKRLKIPIYHMEAGNRCFDFNVPEEINRRIIDHISDFNLVYTEHARRNLLLEGVHSRKIYLTGSPMKEVLLHNMDKIHNSSIMAELKLKKEKYFLISMHREENVDNKNHLKILLATLELLYKKYKLPIIVSTHPRTRKRIEMFPGMKKNDKICFLKPFGYFDYVNLQMNSLCVISDSGSISEEASILSFPAITVRNAIERPEAIDTGGIIVTGINTQTILQSIELVIKERNKSSTVPHDYEITDVSHRVVKLIVGTAKLSHLWDGIVKNTA